MNKMVIKVSNIGKCYTFPKKSTTRIPRNFEPSVDNKSEQEREFWALNNVSFQVAKGERVGLIGANGAGKSTLLKILSRVTQPTSGSAIVRGRLGSLLEVGTGFKASLSGRDNVFLNASVMGFSREFIQARLDDIVEFSELEEFIDIPIKYYSSGMKSKLAFSVATHLTPDILLLDEVLSVGDIAFRQKCLQRIDDMIANGQTIIFVSHSMGSVLKFCDRVIWLDKGSVIFDGKASEGVRLYEDSVLQRKGKIFDQKREKSVSDIVKIGSFDLRGPNDLPPMQGRTGESLVANLEYGLTEHIEDISDVQANLVFYNEGGQVLFGLPSTIYNLQVDDFKRNGELKFELEKLPLMPGIYRVQFSLMINKLSLGKTVAVARLVVVEGDYFGTGMLPPPKYGNMCVNFKIDHCKRA